MSAPIQWRRFMFFEKDVVREDTSSGQPTLQSLDISASTSGRGFLVFGDTSGSIHLVDRTFAITSFKAYEIRVTHLLQAKQHGVLISVGEDEEGINPVVKVWSRDKMDRQGCPACVRTIKVSHNGRPSPVSTLAVLENLTQLAVGLVDGTVILIRGDVSRDRFTRQKILHTDALPITALGFRQVGKDVTLFVATPSATCSYSTSGREVKVELDTEGADLNCGTMSEPDQDFVVGRRGAVYFYYPDSRGSCYAFEGDKKLVTWFRNYLVVVGGVGDAQPQPSAGQSPNPAAKRALGGGSMVTVYDIKNRFIAYSGSFGDVLAVVAEWGSVFVLTSDRRLYQLEERDAQTKLDMLFKKNLYPLAISLASSQHYDYDAIIDIFTQYGDHLYGKNDFDGAIAQYIRTIGHLEPSYVIRKFLDAQRIHNLTSYLQELHEHGSANADHTTLLLNCYTKLKDVKKLDEFIMTDKELNFDVETAIRVCRQASYCGHALYLARKYSQHDWYLRIQLEDVRNYQDALNYISTLDFFEAEKNLKNYGKTLVNHLPEATTRLLIALCTDYKGRGGAVAQPLEHGPAWEGGADPGRPKALSDVARDDGRSPAVAALRARPDEFIHIYVDQMRWLRVFLEYIVQAQPDCGTLVYNTLLELYLRDDANTMDGSNGNMSKETRWELALNLLKAAALAAEGKMRDNHHAMVLAQMYDFKPGILYLYEKAKLYMQIVQYYMENNEHYQIIATCKKYGKQDPNLWIQVLSYFAGKPEGCRKEIAEVLSAVTENNLLPPLLVVQILARSKAATLAVARDYIKGRLVEEAALIAEDEKAIDEYRERTRAMREDIHAIKTSARTFQVVKCSLCTDPLDPPSIHFFCQHSFHIRCVGDNEKVCPLCLGENQKILDMIRAQEQTADQQEKFFKQLEGAPDGFRVVAEHFGRGALHIRGAIPVLGLQPQSQPPPQAQLGAPMGGLGQSPAVARRA
eukprot:Opistho-2@91225